MQRRLRRIEKFLAGKGLLDQLEWWFALRGDQDPRGYVGKLEIAVKGAAKLCRARRKGAPTKKLNEKLHAALEEVRWHGWVGKRTGERPPLVLIGDARKRRMKH